MKKLVSFSIIFLLLIVVGCADNKELKEAKLDIVSAQMSIGQSLLGDEYQTYSYEIRIENVGEAPIEVKEMKVIFSKSFEELIPKNVNKEPFTKTLEATISGTDFVTFLYEIPLETGDSSKEKISGMRKIEGILVTLQSEESQFIPLYQN